MLFFSSFLLRFSGDSSPSSSLKLATTGRRGRLFSSFGCLIDDDDAVVTPVAVLAFSTFAVVVGPSVVLVVEDDDDDDDDMVLDDVELLSHVRKEEGEGPVDR